MNMNTLNSKNINILDLPDEILLIIFHKLHMIEMFYSLVNVNQRFDRLVLDPFCIHHLDLTIEPFLNDNSPANNAIFNRIRREILPRINHKVNKLTIESLSMACILDTIDFTALTSLRLDNFQSEILLQHLTGDTILFRLLTNQITQIQVNTVDNIREISEGNELNILSLILSIGKYLTDVTFTHWWHNQGITFSFFNLTSTTCVSSSLTKLIILVQTFDDCLYLLDGRLKYLSILIISIIKINDSSSNIDNTKKLPKLKYFSLSSSCYTYCYNNRIVPLLRRMSNIEELTLFLSILRNESTYIVGTQLYNDFLVYMPRLNKFTFSIHTQINNNDIDIDLPSANDILNSFTKIGYRQVDLYANDKLTNSTGYCHVYSLPYHFDNFMFMTNRFPGGIFNTVRLLVMLDVHPFENDLFKIISQNFPLLQRLSIDNREPQKTKQHSSTIITFPHLYKLDVRKAHIDYAVEFLFDKNISLPRLTYLFIEYDTLATITEGFTNDAARRTCAQIKTLLITEPIVRPENFLPYFSSL
ncbi:unnamed protein product [Rotaria magnacalcarata]|uniref:F-box domain-containing protein n=2 Tax=Rotaria magnacalcarata TaxID=392030 RepID=A0A816UPE9_9BILA|nr:unnamed protein product [Rotaria magnacalcarata]